MENKDIDQLWCDIEEIQKSDLSISDKYSRYYHLLLRVCVILTSSLSAEYNDLFSRLRAVCRLTGYPLYDIDRFRWRAHRVMLGDDVPDEQTFMADAKVFCEAIAHFTASHVPASLSALFPVELTARPLEHTWENKGKSLRLVVEQCDNHYIYCRSRELPDTDMLKIPVDFSDMVRSVLPYLCEGLQINAVYYTLGQQGEVYPDIVVVDPDNLVDISTLSACIRNYGSSPFNYLFSLFERRSKTSAILLGNAANRFLDDCINDPEACFDKSIQTVFHEDMLAFTACADRDRDFFVKARAQFNNIHHVVTDVFEREFAGYSHGNVFLEPSFFCETLGLQGRMDFLQADMRNLVELKSVKADDYRNAPRMEHLIQMILYKEILFCNLGINRQHVGGYLLYSAYPKLYEQRTVRDWVVKAIETRNAIVMLEKSLREGRGNELIRCLDVEDLNENCVSGKLWNDYQKPVLDKILSVLHSMDSLTSAYFYAFLQFIEREQYHSKVGDNRLDSTRGMASLWNADRESKLLNGDMLADLHIIDVSGSSAIEQLIVAVPELGGCMQPNFRVGDAAVLYECTGPADTVADHQIIRCSVERFSGDILHLRLRNTQHNASLFRKDAVYALEHDYIESSFRLLYSNLFSFLTSDICRRELILNRRQPETNPAVNLNRRYLNPQIDSIVLRAKQAQDLFLLVGPPGTGKTSVALKSMVEEFMSDGCRLLLVAYTNRAVDEICSMLSSVEGCPDYVRLGSELSCGPEFREHLIENKMPRDAGRKGVAELMDRVKIVVGTLTSINGHIELFSLCHFDVAIIDEASQILEPQMLGLVCASDDKGRCAIDRFIMVGDHKQLPAVVVQPEEYSSVTDEQLRGIGLKNCRNSMFERLMSLHWDNPSVVATLDHQGRMHPDIASFASRLFYGGNLMPVPVAHQKRTTLPFTEYTVGDAYFATTRLGFIDVPAPSAVEDSPHSNQAEARMVAHIVDAFRKLYAINSMPFRAESEIGIIVPFRRQIAMVLSEMHRLGIEGCDDMTIDTVERYQGSQRNIIIYATTVTRSYEMELLSNTVEIEGAEVDRKLNVAMTRAKEQMFVVGCRTLLEKNALYRELIASSASTRMDELIQG